MRYYVSIYRWILALLLAIAGCSSDKIADTERIWRQALTAPPKSRDIKLVKHKGTMQVEYWMDEAYPATNLVNWVSSNLKTGGWERIQGSFFNPQIKGVKDDWHTIFDSRETEEQVVHVRTFDWKDSENNVLLYAFEYRYPRGSQPRLQSAHILATFFPSDLAKAALQAGQKELQTIDANKGPK
jgi:hypothetical protein